MQAYTDRPQYISCNSQMCPVRLIHNQNLIMCMHHVCNRAHVGKNSFIIDGFDDLHHAEGILAEAQKRANRLYGGNETETFYLIIASTVSG